MPISYSQSSHLAKRHTLFIHGNLASQRWWHLTSEAWRKRGSLGTGSLYFADWRGCGENPDWPIDRPFTLRELAQDFLDLMDVLGLEQVDLVGHSLGGLIAVQMMILAPARFAKAVLLDPVGAKGVRFDESMYEAFRQMAQNRELTQAVILSTIRGGENLDRHLKDDFADDAFKAVKGIGSSVLEILKTVDLSDDAQKVMTPTLILHGRHDAIIAPADGRSLAELMPKAQFELLEDAGHCWNIEKPAAFTERIRDFL